MTQTELTPEERAELAELLQEMRDLVWLSGDYPPDARVARFIAILRGETPPEGEGKK